MRRRRLAGIVQGKQLAAWQLRQAAANSKHERKTKMATAKFTDYENAILAAAQKSFAGNGFDFGYVDDCRVDGLSPASCGAVLRGLRKKLRLWSDSEFGQLCADWVDGNRPARGASLEEFIACIKPA